MNFCDFIRCSDKNIFQSSVRKNKDDKTIIEKISIKFLLGRSDEVNRTLYPILKNNGVILARCWVDTLKYFQNIE